MKVSHFSYQILLGYMVLFIVITVIIIFFTAPDIQNEWYSSHITPVYPHFHPRLLDAGQHERQTTTTWTNSSLKGLFPDRGVTDDDRILPQLQLKVNTTESHFIIIWYGLSKAHEGRANFVEEQCEMKNCFLTGDKGMLSYAKAVLYMKDVPSQDELMRAGPEQLLILYQLESPFHSGKLSHLKDKINWTATYRRDSVLNTPYGRFLTAPEAKQSQNVTYDQAMSKSKLVAWFVSNCNTKNKRELYVKELEKHIDVDIYGQCGSHKCHKDDMLDCLDSIKRDYKFYLAFENSNCKDYISEKFFRNALRNDIVPIVMGAHPDDYKKVAPPHSYIHVDNFESPKHLADYLHKLDQNDHLYNEYFLWKGTGEFIGTRFWCRLCAMVNIGTEFPMWYGDIEAWWRGDDICIAPSSKPWASWQNRTPSVQDTLNYGFDRHS